MILYNDYLRTKYGTKVYRVAIDAGFSCPSRCAYCNANGSRASYVQTPDSIKDQLNKRIGYLKETKGAKKFIAYFQAFTNTNAPAERLKTVYDNVLPFEDIVGISIGTRPDAVDREKIKLIASYKDRYEVWIEYGLQSAHDRTLRSIGRGHTFEDFADAVNLTKEFGIPVCCHVILGLPGETEEDMMETARELNRLNIEGIKIHVLHILKGSAMEGLYKTGKIKLLEQDEYVRLVCKFLKNLPEDIIVQRMTGQGNRSDHIAPLWALYKTETIGRIIATLKQ